MGDTGDDYKAMRDFSKERKAERVPTAIRKLQEAGINFDRRNGDQHLIVEGFDCFIDFWPSTDRWNARIGGVKGFGLSKLIAYIKGTE